MKKEHLKEVVVALYDAMFKATVEHSFPDMKDETDFNETQKKLVMTPDGPRYCVSFIMVSQSEELRDAFAKMISEATDDLARATGDKPVHVVPMKGRAYMNGEHIGDFRP
jgi:dihydroxyacetone kinase-like predicted kinase